MFVKVKLNVPLKNHLENSIINIQVYDELDENGDYIPKDSYWRRRIKDALKDNCVSILNEEELEVYKTTKDDLNNKNKITEKQFKSIIKSLGRKK